MKLDVDATVKKKMESLEPADFVLDFDHTLSEELVAVDACVGGISRYRIVAVNKGEVPKDFDAHLESEFGPIYYKKWGNIFFNEDLKARVEGSYGLIALKTSGETISNNLLIVDFKGKKARG